MISLAELRAMPKEELAAKFERMKHAVANAKEHTERIAENVIDTALAGAGGLLSGYLTFKHPKVMGDGKDPTTGYDSDAVASILPLGLVLSGMAKGHERQILAIGQGLTGAFASREFITYLQKRKAAADAAKK